MSQPGCTCQFLHDLHAEDCAHWELINEPHTPVGASAEQDSEGHLEELHDDDGPVSQKRPLTESAADWDNEEVVGYDEDDAEPVLPRKPDLRWFFQQYGLNEVSQISVCRTHANALAAMLRIDRGESTGARSVGRPRKQKK